MEEDAVSNVTQEASIMKRAIINNPARTAPSVLLLHELFQATSSKIVLSHLENFRIGLKHFEKSELDDLSNRLAQQLINSGVYKQIVPIVLPQCPELYIAILGVLKAGNAYCPILPNTPQERIAFICEDIEASVLLCTDRTRLPQMNDIKLMHISTFNSQQPIPLPRVTISSMDLAYVMYTSGTTGRPKGVMISHAAATSSILAHGNMFMDLQDGDAFLQFANPTFDISIFEIFSAWAWGMTLVSVKRDLLISSLPQIIQHASISHLELTPSMADILPDQHDPCMRSVRRLITIGEMLTRKIIRGWAGKLFNAYGPTEATLHVSYVAVDDVEFDPRDIGCALSSCTLAILEPDSERILAEGEVGELCIAGHQIAQGYLHRADLSTKVFVRHPSFQGQLYRTGDLAHISDNGHAYFHGRIQGDSQVKINGQRIELGELVHSLETEDGIQSAAVLIISGVLIAFVVVACHKHDLEFGSIIDRLPFKVRPHFVTLEHMPTTSSGKRDYRRLEMLAKQNLQHDSQRSSETRGPGPNQQNLILDVIRNVVSATITVNDSFTNYGLDSLDAIKIVMKLRSCGWHLEVADVLEANSANALTQRLKINKTRQTELPDKLPESLYKDLVEQYGEDCQFAPCSATQASMLAATFSAVDSKPYMNHVLFKTTGGYSHQSMANAWQALCAHHEILRTGFHSNTDSSEIDFIQIIHRPKIDSIDLEVIDEQDLEQHVTKHKHSFSIAHISLSAIGVRHFKTPASAYLSIVIHHALYDAWSLDLMLLDLKTLLSGGNLEATPQYRHMMKSCYSEVKLSEAKRTYWTEYLENFHTPPLPVLACASTKESMVHRSRTRCSMTLEEIDQACISRQISPQVMGQLIWSLILSWITGETDVCMALTTSGRTLPIEGIERTLGPFISTYPFIMNFSEEQNIAQAFKDITTYNLQLLKYNLPYRDVLKCSSHQGRPDTLFIYQKSGANVQHDQDLQVVKQHDSIEFAVMLNFDRCHDGMYLELQADLNLINPTTATKILDLINTLISRVLTISPEQNLSQLKVLPDSLSSIANPRPSDRVEGRLDEIVESRCRSDPSAPALQFYDDFDHSQTLTYAELDLAASRLASTIADEQIMPGDVIAICLEKSTALYVSILAVLKLGCAYLAIEPALPQKRVDTLLEITNVSFVFSDGNNRSRFPSQKVIEAGTIINDKRHSEFKSRPSNGLCYVLMTSGTTGVPKACLVTHSNVLSNCSALSKIYPHSPGDRMMQFTSFAFDVSVFEIFFSWYHGMCLVSCPRNFMLSNLSKVLQIFKITHLNMTPSAASLIHAKDLTSLKCFITSGEITTRSIVKEWGATGHYFNAYGPTETTNVCTAHLVNSDSTHPSMLGKVLENTSAYILDHDLQVVPIFAPGELYIGGAQVIRGYLNDERRTLASFIAHPELGRIYRTGDVARFLDDSSLLILGRNDTQVKIRGNRVELEEISHTLRTIESVRDSVTLLIDGRLVAFVCLNSPKSDWDFDVQRLYKALSDKLPDYMSPASIVPLPGAIPLTSTYKTDNSSLITIYEQQAEKTDDSRSNNAPSAVLADWNPISRKVADIITKFSGAQLEDMTPDTSIFKLGLDSISAIKISSVLKQNKVGDITVSDIMKNGTPAGIAREIQKYSEDNNESEIAVNHFAEVEVEIKSLEKQILVDLALEEQDVSEILPCTSLQEGMLLETLKDADVSYINHSVLEFRDRIDSKQLASVCQRLVDATPMLRTCFAYTSSRSAPCVQVVLKQFWPHWEEQHADELEPALSELKVAAAQNLDLHRPPVKFLSLITPTSQYLIISLHHSLFDGWSLDLIREDFEKLCRSLPIPSRPNCRPILEVAYNASIMSEKCTGYWSQYLRDYEPFSFPHLSTTSGTSLRIISSSLSSSLGDITACAHKHDQSLLSFLQACWSMKLAQLAGTQDICFATAMSGRTLPITGVENAILPLFNVLPTRIDLQGSSSVLSIVQELHQSNLVMSEYSHSPLRRVVQLAGLKGDRKLFDTILILQQPQSLGDGSIYKSIEDYGDNDYALMLEFIPDLPRKKLCLRLTAKDDVVSSANLEFLAGQISDTLLEMLKDPTKSISDIAYAHNKQYASLSAPMADFTTEELLHSAFLKNAESRPNQVAIRYLHDFDDSCRCLTYQELRIKVDSLSARLRSSGCPNSTPVVVMISGVPELFIAFLAILQAGLIYTPLSTDTPEARLQHILQDLTPSAVLTNNEEVIKQLGTRMTSILILDIRDTVESTFDEVPMRPDSIAYLIHTSGTTGHPKAVMISHSAAVATVESSRHILSIDDQARWLQFAPLTFDMSIYDMSIAFSYGVCLCAAPRQLLLEDLPRVIRSLQVTHLDLTPSVAQTLEPGAVPSVESLFCIGEKITQRIIDQWGSKCLNVYGPTEAAMACTYHQILSNSVPSNIGRSFIYVQSAIFELNDDRPTAIFAPGELCIAGPQLSQGYLHDPQKTDASFFDFEATRFYRTGDMCRMLPDQSIMYLERRDTQVKLRGQRIELEEISFVMSQNNPNIAAATTLLLHSGTQSIEQVVSFVARSGIRQGSSQLQLQTEAEFEVITDSLKKDLPLYMIPAYIVQLDWIPLSTANKIDKRSLAKLFKEYLQAQNEHKVTEGGRLSAQEQLLYSILEEISGVEMSKITRTTTIYHLGLDSISAIQIVSALRKHSLVLSVIDVLRNPVVGKLVTRLQVIEDAEKVPVQAFAVVAAAGEEFDSLQVTLKRKYSGTNYPCTPVQENMIAQFINSDGNSYYNHQVLMLHADVDINRLKASWIETIASHEILRCGFLAVDSKECHYALSVHDTSISSDLWSTHKTCNISTEVESRIAILTQALLNDLNRPSLAVSHLDASDQQLLLFSAHHAIYDGSSLDSIFAEVSARYHGNSVESRPTTRDSARTIWSLFHDPDRHEKSMSYLRRALEVSEFTPFPNLNNKTNRNNKFEVYKLPHSHKLSDVERYCRELGLSLNNVAMAVWAKILSSYTGEPTIRFGVVLSGRTGTNLDDAIYPCLTTVPFSCDLSTIGTNRDAARHFTECSSRVLEFQHISLSEISQNEVTKLFDTLFVYQRKHVVEDVDLWRIDRDITSVEIPISVEIVPNAHTDSIEFILTSQSSKIPGQHAKLLLRQYDELLWSMIQNPEQPIIDCELGLPKDLLSLLVPTSPKLDAPVQLLHKFVSHFALLTPDAIALEFAQELENDAQLWTYRELENDANRFAHYLMQKHGLTDSGPIAICLDKSPEAFIGILAVLKTGSPFCCLDPSAPIERRKFILEDSGAIAVICSQLYHSELAGCSSVKVISVEISSGLSEVVDEPIVHVVEDSLCYVLYTSGSTGTPKGCKISHLSAVQALTSFKTEFRGRFSAQSRFLAFASLHFDVSILESYFSWSIGARVCAAPKDALLSDIPGAIKKFQITHLDLTPQLAMTLLRDEAPTLQVFITGGEMLRAETVEHWGDTGILFNFYGPTEATIGCTALKQVEKDSRPSNIGQQWSNCGSMVVSPLGRSKKPALRGAVGTLIISGTQVGDGYVNLEEATKKRFSHSELLGGRTYDTGDLVRLLEIDLSFDFVGRADSQVKLRGQRIETGEIDSVLLKSNADITDSITLVLQHPTQQKEQLISFVIYRGTLNRTQVMEVIHGSESVSELFSACQKLLPVYMIPSYIVPLNKLELTATNKIDVKKIKILFDSLDPARLHDFSCTSSTEGLVKVDDSVVRQIKNIVQEMTGKQVVDERSSVFQLGLDSVSLVGLVRKMRSAGFSRCTVSMIMTSSSVIGLAAALATTSASVDEDTRSIEAYLRQFHDAHLNNVSQQLQLSPDEIEDVLPANPLVEGLLVESLRGDHNLHMNKWRIARKDVNLEQLHKAVDALIRQTPVLRSRFVIVPEGLAQVILCPKSRSKNISSPESPLKSSLLRLEYDEDTDRGNFIELVFHHALYDGVSLDLILFDLQHLYHDLSFEICRPAIRPAVAHILSLDSASAKEFWYDLLGKSVSLLPVRRGRTIEIYKVKSKVSTSELEDFARKTQCTPNMVISAVFSIFIRRLFHQDGVFGLVVAGRECAIDRVAEIAYPMFNTLPIFIKTSDYKDSKQLITQLQQIYGNLLAFEHSPLRDIKKLLSIPSEIALFDFVLVYQKSRSSSSIGTSDTLEFEEHDTAKSGFALALDVTAPHFGKLEFLLQTEAIGATTEVLCSIFDTLLYNLLNGTDPLPSPNTNDGIVEIDFTVHRSSVDMSPQNPSRDEEMTRDPIAKDILFVLARLLNTPAGEISTSASFFSLGLDSIDAIKLAAQLRQNHEQIVSVSEILQHSSVKSLCRLLAERDGSSIGRTIDYSPKDFSLNCSEALNIEIPYDEILPAAPTQEGILTMSQSDETGLYLNHSLVRLKTGIKPSQIEQAWHKVINQNDILRTSFMTTRGQSVPLSCDYVQIVHAKSGEFSIDRESVPEKTLMSSYRAYKQHLKSNTRFNDVPLYLRIFETDRSTYLAITIHHALYDGASLDMLYQDLGNLVQSKSEPKDRPTFSLLVDHIMQTSSAEADLFWTKYLRRCIPKLRTITGLAKVTKAQRTSSIPVSALRACARLLDVSMQALAQSAFAVFMMQLLEQSDILFGVVQAGRSFAPEAEQIIGPCMNTVVMRAAVEGHTTMQDLAQSLHTDNLAMIEHIHTPLTRVQKKIGKGLLFETLFVFQNNTEDLPQETIWDVVEEDSNVEFPLALECCVTSDVINWTVALQDDYVDSLETIVDRVDVILTRLVTEPQRPIFADHDSIFNKSKDGSNESDTSDSDSEGYAIIDPREAQIAEEISALTKSDITNMSRHASIFEMGLDSISIIELSKRLRKKQIRISVANILRNPSIREMHRVLTFKQDSEGSVVNEEVLDARARTIILSEYDHAQALQTIHADSNLIQTIVPATASQIYFLTTWQALNGTRFMSNFTFTLQSAAALEIVKNRWQILCQGQDILRTTFSIAKDNTTIVQCVYAPRTHPINEFRTQATNMECAINNFIDAADFPRPDFTYPPVSLTAVISKTEETCLVLSIHHALYDAVSLANLVRSLRDGLTVKPLLSYHKFSDLAVNHEAQSVKWWATYLAGCTPFCMSPQNSPQSSTTKTNHKAKPQLDFYASGKGRSLSRLKEKLAGLKTTVQAAITAAVGKSLAELNRTENVVLGMYTSGRSIEIEGVEDVFGPTVNIIPLRIDTAQSRSLSVLAKDVHHSLTQMNGFIQQVPINRIFEATGWSQLKGGLVDVTLNILPRTSSDQAFASKGPSLDKPNIIEYARLSPVQISRIRDTYAESFSRSTVFGQFVGHGCVQPVLDIEVEIVDDDVNFGIFCDEEMLSQEQATLFVDRVWECLMEPRLEL